MGPRNTTVGGFSSSKAQSGLPAGLEGTVTHVTRGNRQSVFLRTISQDFTCFCITYRLFKAVKRQTDPEREPF